MATYSYVDNTGAMKTIDAASSDAALQAPDIGKNSGVQLYRSQQGGTPSPYATPAPKTGSYAGNVDATPGTTTPSTTSNADSILSGISASYSNTNTDPLSIAKKKIVDIFGNIPDAPSEASILSQKQAAVQALINEINSQYTGTYNAAKVGNDNREARVRALSSNAGLSGSNVASSNAESAAGQSAKNISMIDDEKNAKINSILGNVSSQASDEYAKRRAAYLAEIDGDYTKINDFQTSEISLAKKNMASLASNGVDLASLKTKAPDTYDALLKQSGMDPVVFAAAYNESLPANQKRTYSYQKIGNQLYAISTNPATNKIETQQINTPNGEDYDKFMIAPDGTPLFINTKTGKATEGTGNYSKPLPVKATGGKGGGGVTASQKTEENNALNWIRRQSTYDKSDETKFSSDPSFKAWAIHQAKLETAAEKIT